MSEPDDKRPLRFEANEGQSDAQVRFLSRGSGYTLFLTPAEAVLVLSRREAQESARSQPRPTTPAKPEKTKTAVLRMTLVGANPAPRVRGLEELPGKSNYVVGNDPTKWYPNVANYARVEYQDVYPGVHLVYYGNQRQLEYDLVVTPGADPAAVTLAFDGADRLMIDSVGDLVLQTPGGEVRMRKPLTYQQGDRAKHPIAGHYILKGKNTVGFHVAAYDASKPLVIDPVLSYSTYLGGSGGEVGVIAVDGSGNAYVAGWTTSPDFPAVNAFQPAFGGGTDAFVTRLNVTGGVVYSTYLGGGGSDNGGVAVAVDGSGNATVMGTTDSPDFPTVNAFQAALGGGTDTFVTRLNATGGVVYSTYLGGSSEDEGVAIAVDGAGNAYLTGLTISPDFPTANAFQPAPGGGADAFVTKFNGTGGVVYSTYLGGNGDFDFLADAGFAIAADGSGSAYVTGSTNSPDFPTTVNAFQSVFGGAQDAFVTKFNATGGLVYSTYLGGGSGDHGFAIAADGSGNAYVTGSTDSPDFPTTVNAFQSVFGGGVADAFVATLNAIGGGVYSTYLGSANDDQGFAIAVDGSGNAYVTGPTDSPGFPTVNAFQPVVGGDYDAFVATLNAIGGVVYSTYLGGAGSDWGVAIAVGGAGNAYVTGPTSSPDFPTANAFQSVFGGGLADAFVAKLNATGGLVYSTYLGGNGDDTGSIGIAIDASGNAYVGGSTDSTDFPTVSPFQAANAGSSDAFAAKLNAEDSASAGEGETVTVTTAPRMAGQAGVTATLINNTPGSGPATVTVTTYGGNPTTVNIIDVGGGFVDLRVTGADPTDLVTASFYYSSTVTGATETDLQLFYFTGSAWAPVLSTGGTAPLKDTTDNLDSTISGGRFLVTFGNTSTPQITQLTGTVFAMTVPPQAAVLYLHASGSTLYLDGTAPTATTPQFRDSASLRFSGGNPWKAIGTWTAAPAGSPQELVGLSDLHVWLGLRNSDDQGTRFDLRAEVFKNNTLLASGETFCITGVTRDPDNAKEVTVAFGAISEGTFAPGDVLALRVLTRIGTTGGGFCGGHSNATGLRLYFDAVSRPARFGVTFEAGP